VVAPKDFEWSFTSIFAYKSTRALFLAVRDSENEEGEDISYFFSWDGKWGSDELPLTATEIGVANLPRPAVVFMSVDGRILTRSGTVFEKEIVDSSESGPHRSGDLREMRMIGGIPYVVGMSRTAYRREDKNMWVRFDQGLRSEDPTDDSGLNSIDGSADGKELLAVGWGGEIWRRKSEKWSQISSPTNLALFKVLRLSDKSYLAVGQLGMILHIVGNVASVVEHSATKDDFYGIASFRNKVFLSTTNGLFTWTNNTCEPVEIKSKKKVKVSPSVSFFLLHSTEDLIWSMGQKMILFSPDGVTWEETPYS
jgi:hypothetical protein